MNNFLKKLINETLSREELYVKIINYFLKHGIILTVLDSKQVKELGELIKRYNELIKNREQYENMVIVAQILAIGNSEYNIFNHPKRRVKIKIENLVIELQGNKVNFNFTTKESLSKYYYTPIIHSKSNDITRHTEYILKSIFNIENPNVIISTVK